MELSSEGDEIYKNYLRTLKRNSQNINERETHSHGIYYNNQDSIFQLVRRWNLKYADVSLNTPYSSEIYAEAEITVGATVTDSSTDDPNSGMPVTVVSEDQTYNLITDSNGEASVTLTVGEIGSTFSGIVYAGKESDDWSYKVPAFVDFFDYADSGDTGLYDIVKYPTDITPSFEIGRSKLYWKL